MITQSELKEILTYNPVLGIFTRLTTGGGFKIGSMAGSLHHTGYIIIKIKGKSYPAHHLAWLYAYSVIPKELDHINHIKDDNRIINLREVTHQENCKNRSMRKDNSSGIIGVYWHKRDKKWTPIIIGENKRIHIGRFDDFFEACCARKSAENKYDYHPNHGSSG